MSDYLRINQIELEFWNLGKELLIQLRSNKILDSEKCQAIEILLKELTQLIESEKYISRSIVSKLFLVYGQLEVQSINVKEDYDYKKIVNLKMCISLIFNPTSLS